MAAPRLVVDLTIGKEDMMKLMAIARSRTGPATIVNMSLKVRRKRPIGSAKIWECSATAVATHGWASCNSRARPAREMTFMPSSAARRWIMRQASTRCMASLTTAS